MIVLANKSEKLFFFWYYFSGEDMKKLDIIYEDKEIIVVNKEAKLLTISTNKEQNHTLYNEVSSYVKKQHPKNKIFIVHRLDKDTSGVILFAKNEKLKKAFQNDWDNIAIKREYVALVEGNNIERGTIKSYLYETKNFQVLSTNNPNRGKLAITEYESFKEGKRYSLVNINIITGRKNQIRVHLKDIGHSIVGDKKYGALTNPINRLGLHATKLVIKHPLTKEIMTFESNIPKTFDNAIK